MERDERDDAEREAHGESSRHHRQHRRPGGAERHGEQRRRERQRAPLGVRRVVGAGAPDVVVHRALAGEPQREERRAPQPRLDRCGRRSQRRHQPVHPLHAGIEAQHHERRRQPGRREAGRRGRDTTASGVPRARRGAPPRFPRRAPGPRADRARGLPQSPRARSSRRATRSGARARRRRRTIPSRGRPLAPASAPGREAPAAADPPPRRARRAPGALADAGRPPASPPRERCYSARADRLELCTPGFIDRLSPGCIASRDHGMSEERQRWLSREGESPAVPGEVEPDRGGRERRLGARGAAPSSTTRRPSP